MSEALETLNRVAELLPEGSRERFFATIARLRNVPDDDEFLLVLKSIGFMTLLWREVPGQVREVLAASNPGGRPETNAFLAADLRKAVKEALDVPTYADMRLLASRLEEQHEIFKASMERLMNGRGAAPTHTRRHPEWFAAIIGVLLGAVLTLAADKWIPVDFGSVLDFDARQTAG